MSDAEDAAKLRAMFRAGMANLPREIAGQMLNARFKPMFPGCDEHDRDTPGCSECDRLFGFGVAQVEHVNAAAYVAGRGKQRQRDKATKKRGPRGWLPRLLALLHDELGELPRTWAELRPLIEGTPETLLEQLENVAAVRVEDDGDGTWVVAEFVDGGTDRRFQPEVMRAARRTRRRQ